MEGAENLLTGDASFISRSARVTVRTLLRPESHRRIRSEAAIDVVYPVLGYQPESYPTYRTWSWGKDDVSAPVSFEVPIDGTNGLQLLLSQFNRDMRLVKENVDHKPEAFERVLLTVGSSSVIPKLRRGLYAIAFREDGSQGRPNWQTIAIARRNGKFEVSDELFSYVILSVDYAA